MDNITKSPIEKFPVYFNFSMDLLFGESISSHTLSCVNSATGVSSKTTIVDSSEIVANEVKAVLKAGTEDDEHFIQCSVSTSLSNIFQRDLLLFIQSVVSDSFNKHPIESFMYEVDFTRRLEGGDSVVSGVVVATRESDGGDVTASITNTVEVVNPKVGVPVKNGSDGETYLLGTRATSDDGYVYEKIIRMNVQEL